jgi:hypothetical protein
MLHPRAALLATALAVALVAAPRPAAAESDLPLPAPDLEGDIPAQTYDLEGERVGEASLGVSRLDGGNYLLHARSGIEGSARTEMSAELEPLGDGRVRLVRQRSQSHDEQGASLGVMRIDHQRGVATCTPAPGSGDAPVEIPLPKRDRVVNIPLNLLFEPLVRGETEEVDFQLLLCRVGGGRIVDAHAEVASEHQSDGGRMVEVRYEVDLGPLLSRLAAPFMPQLSLWFDEQSPGAWIGHRMPLFSKGPTVLVVRTGFDPAVLSNGR